jgi:hypothetical protein
MAVVVVPVVVEGGELLLALLVAAGIIATAKTIPKIKTKTKEECKPEHRGRIQAQGGGLEDSEPWAQTFPPPKAQGIAQLEGLFARLSDTDQEIRARACTQIQGRILGGPISAPFIKSYYAPPGLQVWGDERMDLEVRVGLAFV